MSEHVEVTKSEGILTLVLNRPAKKNALTATMYAALADAIESSQTDREVHVILIRSEGDTFTSGNDVGEFAAVAMGGGPPHEAGRFIRAIATASKPLVAAVQGRAVGVGTTMLLHCDYVVLAEGAQLTAPFVSLALVPEAASTLLLPARIGHLRAFSMFALGDSVSAETALAWGLANQVVPAIELVATVETVARRLAKQPLGALIATKKLMRATGAITSQMDVETQHFLERLTTPEAREAFAAFAERRAPDFAKLG